MHNLLLCAVKRLQLCVGECICLCTPAQKSSMWHKHISVNAHLGSIILVSYALQCAFGGSFTHQKPGSTDCMYGNVIVCKTYFLSPNSRIFLNGFINISLTLRHHDYLTVNYQLTVSYAELHGCLWIVAIFKSPFPEQ